MNGGITSNYAMDFLSLLSTGLIVLPQKNIKISGFNFLKIK